MLGRMDIALEMPRLGGGTTAAKPLKRKANAVRAHPPPRLLVLARTARRRRGLSCQVWSRNARRTERASSLGGGNDAPPTTARTRTVHLRWRRREPQDCLHHHRHRRNGTSSNRVSSNSNLSSSSSSSSHRLRRLVQRGSQGLVSRTGCRGGGTEGMVCTGRGGLEDQVGIDRAGLARRWGRTAGGAGRRSNFRRSLTAVSRRDYRRHLNLGRCRKTCSLVKAVPLNV